MPSNSLIRWRNERTEALDEIENAHVMVGGSERGRRFATQQINFAYAALLSSQFQGFCRDLHIECVDHIVGLVPNHLEQTIREEFRWNRRLDRGNPHPGAIGSDFNRLGMDIWNDVYGLDVRNSRRRELLEELIEWRNAIAHQDFNTVAAGGIPRLQLGTVRAWRRALNALVRSFDTAAYNYLFALSGAAPCQAILESDRCPQENRKRATSSVSKGEPAPCRESFAKTEVRWELAAGISTISNSTSASTMNRCGTSNCRRPTLNSSKTRFRQTEADARISPASGAASALGLVQRELTLNETGRLTPGRSPISARPTMDHRND